VRYQLQLSRDETAIEDQIPGLWGGACMCSMPRWYSSPWPKHSWPIAGAPIIERDFSRLKGRPLGLRPVYLHREDHLKGLVRLLSLALRILTLAEFVAPAVRCKLKMSDLAGLYPGNPKQQTHRNPPPSACWRLSQRLPCPWSSCPVRPSFILRRCRLYKTVFSPCWTYLQPFMLIWRLNSLPNPP
jgi:hypothetical protein